MNKFEALFILSEAYRNSSEKSFSELLGQDNLEKIGKIAFIFRKENTEKDFTEMTRQSVLRAAEVLLGKENIN